MPELSFLLLVLLIVCPILYILQTLVIYVGTHRVQSAGTPGQPTVAVLVALRDEEATVAECLQSLLELDYPRTHLQIFLINDRSRDRTPAIIEEFARKSPIIRVLHIRHTIPGMSGKANAISQALDQCDSELILVTDGDCRVPGSWVKAHVSCYTERVGLVGGFTLLDKKDDNTRIFGKIQSLDWAYLLSVGSGAIGFGLPLSVLGNNFSFRREAYEQVGGYRNMGFTIIEDFALMKALVRQTKWQVLYPISEDMLVYSHPMPNLRRFANQRKRWSAGGKEVGWYGKLLMLIAVLVHLAIPVGFFTTHVQLAVAALASILAADFCLLARTTGIIKRRGEKQDYYKWVWKHKHLVDEILENPDSAPKKF